MSGLSIRWRLTLWYGAVLSTILVGFSVAVFLLMERHLLELTDSTLREELDELAAEVKRVDTLTTLPLALSSRFPDQEGYELEVRTPGGATLFRSAGMGSAGLPQPVIAQSGHDAATYEIVRRAGQGPVRMASRVVPGPSGPLLIQAAITLIPNLRALRELVTALLTLGPPALACAVGGGYWMARKALSPVDRMAATAEPVSRDELGYLAQTFNAMIARLQRSFDEVRRFTADAAHELRTPLAAMRTEAEVALRSPRSPDRDSRVLENLLEEIERLSRLVSHLLFLCREETGVGVSQLRPLRLDTLVSEVAEHMDVAARDKGIELLVEFAKLVEVNGEADRLRQLFFNLLDNAIKYTPAPGRVTVQGETSNGHARVTVSDTGIGIPDEHLPHVFERFYRVDPSRSPETAGHGLGLAICRSIAESHAGRLEIVSTVGTGTSVTLILPRQREDGKS